MTPQWRLQTRGTGSGCRHDHLEAGEALGVGREVVLNAPENSADNPYIQSMTFNGTEYSKNWLSYSELMKGATIDFKMGDQPNLKRGIDDGDFPYSMTTELKE